jgi:hypothetical protein
MKIKKRFIFLFVFILIIFSTQTVLWPAWFSRLIGYDFVVETDLYPQWINNQELVYLKLVSYSDRGLSGWQMISWRLIKIPMANFYIYKTNINNLKEKKLIKKFSKRVVFDAADIGECKRTDKSLGLRLLEDGNIYIFINKGNYYSAYLFNMKGRTLKRYKFDDRFFGTRDWNIIDVSPDGENLLAERYRFYIKNIKSREKELLLEPIELGEPIGLGDVRGKYITNNDIFFNARVALEGPENIQVESYALFLIDVRTRKPKQIYFAKYKSDTIPSPFACTFSPDSRYFALSNEGIFTEVDGSWKKMKDFSYDLEFLSFSPDSKRIAGIDKSGRLKVVEIE